MMLDFVNRFSLPCCDFSFGYVTRIVFLIRFPNLIAVMGLHSKNVKSNARIIVRTLNSTCYLSPGKRHESVVFV